MVQRCVNVPHPSVRMHVIVRGHVWAGFGHGVVGGRLKAVCKPQRKAPYPSAGFVRFWATLCDPG